MPVAVTGYAHVRLTVTDIAQSRRFYDDVFGFPAAYEVPQGPDETTKEQLAFLFGGLIYALPGGQLLALRPVAPEGDAFDTDRVGLDHLSIAVDDLDAAVAVLDELGVTTRTSRTSGSPASLSSATPTGSRWSSGPPRPEKSAEGVYERPIDRRSNGVDCQVR